MLNGTIWIRFNAFKVANGGSIQDIHIVAEQFDGNVAAYAGNQFIEAQLYWLREFVIATRQTGDGFLYCGQ